MSINKHVDDHYITGIAQVSIRDRFRPCSRDSSGGKQRENQIKQCSDGEQNLQTDIMHRHHAKRVFLVERTKL